MIKFKWIKSNYNKKINNYKICISIKKVFKVKYSSYKIRFINLSFNYIKVQKI